MNLAILLLVLLFCGITWAQDDGNAIDTQSQPDEYDLLREVLALREELGAVKARLSDSQTEIRELRNKEFGAVKEKLEVMETRLNHSENKERTMVVFSAFMRGTNHVGPFNTDKTLVYNRVYTNIGNAYNQFTGIFVAPVAGVYYFTFFYHAPGRIESFLSLIRNNVIVVDTSDHETDNDGADNGGNAVFLELQRGDHLHVRLRAHSHVWGNGQHTTFSGFLVSRG